MLLPRRVALLQCFSYHFFSLLCRFRQSRFINSEKIPHNIENIPGDFTVETCVFAPALLVIGSSVLKDLMCKDCQHQCACGRGLTAQMHELENNMLCNTCTLPLPPQNSSYAGFSWLTVLNSEAEISFHETIAFWIDILLFFSRFLSEAVHTQLRRRQFRLTGWTKVGADYYSGINYRHTNQPTGRANWKMLA